MAICHRVELRVYDRTGTGTYDVLPASSIKGSWALGGGGFLAAQAESRAEPLASDPDLLDDCVIKVAIPLTEPGTTLTEVAAYANRGRAGVLWAGAGQQIRRISQAGTLFTVWSQDAILHPEGNVITQMTGDQRYFGWMSSIYDPTGDGWQTPTTIGQQDSHGYATRTGMPEDWPADLGNAYWISGTGGRRQLFIADLTLSAATGITVFFSSDESATVYVAGELVIQTSSVESGYQSMEQWSGLLQAGTYRIGIDKTSIDHSGFDLGLGGDSGPADPVLLAVAVGDGAGGWTPLLMTNTSQWRTYGIDPEMGQPPSLTPGEIVAELYGQAVARGVDTWDLLTLDFDGEADSDGDPWPVREERAWRVAYDRHLDMIEGLGDLGFCPEITPDLTFKAWGNRGTDRSATVTLATLDEVDRVDEAGVGVAATYMPVETQDGWVVVSAPTAEAAYGRRETALSLGNAPSIAQGRRLGQKVLDDRLSQPETEWAVQFYARAGSVPFVDFWPGDTVMVSIGGTPTPRVVLDLGFEADHTEAIVRWTAKTGGVARVGRFATEPGNALAEGGVGALWGLEAGVFATSVGNANASGGEASFGDGSASFYTESGFATASGVQGSLTVAGDAESGVVAAVAYNHGLIAASTPVNVTVPSDVQAGDILLLFAGNSGDGTPTGPSGFSTVAAKASNSVYNTITGFGKVAAGTEGGTTITWYRTAENSLTSVLLVIRGAANEALTDVYVSTAATGSSTPDTPSLSPTPGSASYLWLTAMVHTSRNVTAAPTGYEAATAGENMADGNGSIGSAATWKVATAATEDPGAYTMSDTGTRYVGYTLAVLL